MNYKIGFVFIALGASCLLFGCGTVSNQMANSQTLAVTPTPTLSNVAYINYATPSHDYVKSVFQQTVKPGATVSVYNSSGVAPANLISTQSADSLGMFILDIGDNVPANATVYLVVQEFGKTASAPLTLP